MQSQPPTSMMFTPQLREELRFALEDAKKEGLQRDNTIRFNDQLFVIAYAEYMLQYLDTQLPASELVKPPLECEICPNSIEDIFYDARLISGTVWTIMCPKCFDQFGTGKFGPTDARMYRRKSESLFIQVK